MKIDKELLKKSTNEYKVILENKVLNTDNENILYYLFTEITLLRISLDKHDSRMKNFFDAKIRKENLNLRDLIIVQFDDVLDGFSKYNKMEKEKILEILSKINNKCEFDKGILENIRSSCSVM